MSELPSYATLRLRREATNPRILRLTLNRPERLNAISEAMPAEIRAAVTWAEADDLTHVLVLDGAGRALCAEHCTSRSTPWTSTRR
jgi:enoyl-CoA hydratase